MNKVLIIYSHPSHDGHSAYFLDCIKNLLNTKSNISYEIFDLYAINYDPILKNDELYSANRKAVSLENLNIQEKIKDADRLIFIYPTWWQNMPAILKGFIDRVLVSGFAFIYKNGKPVGLLTNKKAAVFTTTGGPHFYSILFKKNRSLNILIKDVLLFVGIKARGYSIGSAGRLSDENKSKIKKISEKVIHYLVS